MARKNEKENLLTQTAGKNKHIWWHICNSHMATHRPKIAKEPPSQRTSTRQTMYRITKLDRRAACNRRLAQWRVKWLIEHSTSHQLLWCIDNFVLRNPPLRHAPKRYNQWFIKIPVILQLETTVFCGQSTY